MTSAKSSAHHSVRAPLVQRIAGCHSGYIVSDGQPCQQLRLEAIWGQHVGKWQKGRSEERHHVRRQVEFALVSHYRVTHCTEGRGEGGEF